MKQLKKFKFKNIFYFKHKQKFSTNQLRIHRIIMHVFYFCDIATFFETNI